MRIEACVSCTRPFEISEIGGGMPGTKESEDITCPYCDFTRTERSNGMFRTHKLSEEREKQWREEQRK
jgi:DNA-directed RNA polymerase subunit RPC12/RpoP